MKYLRKFNEELSPSTYSSAAWKLNNKYRKTGNEDLKRRSDELRKYSEDLSWKEMIENYSRFGKVSITTQVNEKGDKITGDFYLILIFDTNPFEESVEDYLASNKLNYNFAIGMIPVDEETKVKFSEQLPEGDFDNGFFWLAWASLDFEETEDGLTLKTIDCNSYDWSVSGKIIFSRPLLGVIRKHILAAFSEDSNYKSGYTTHETLYDLLETETLIAHGVSSHFGIDMKELYEQIKAYSVNNILAQDKQNW